MNIVTRAEKLFLFLILCSAEALDQSETVLCDVNNATATGRQFAYALYNTAAKLIGKRRNILLSPLAVGMSLSMLYQGASGLSKEQLRKVLTQGDRSFKNKEYCALVAYRADRFNSQFILKDEGLPNIARLRTATRVFGDRNLTFRADFVRDTGLYGIEMTVVPFQISPRYAERQINKWVSYQSDGAIRQIIAASSLERDTLMAVTCSLYFKGSWISSFVNVTVGNFFLPNRHRKSISFMTSQTPVRYLRSEAMKSDLAEISYDAPDDSNIDPSLVFFLPFESEDIGNVENNLKDDDIQTILNGNQTEDIRIRIPKFSFSGPQKLKYFLKKMGVKEIFNKHKSNLFKTVEDKGKKVFITQTIHKLKFEVDEYGSPSLSQQAAMKAKNEPITGNVANCYGKCQLVLFDRPFLFVLYDKFTDTIIYIGRVSDPGRRL